MFLTSPTLFGLVCLWGKTMGQVFNVAVVGATGQVGEAVLELLEAREFPVESLHLLASEQSAGKQIQFKDKNYKVESADDFDFSRAQVAFFVAGAEVSEALAQQAVDQGCFVIDGSGCFNTEYDVPVIVPEVNPEAVAEFQNRGILASPGADAVFVSTIVAPIHRHAAVKRLNVVSCQAVSAAGRKGVEELAGQTARLLNAQTPETSTFQKQIAFNVLPATGEVNEDGYVGWELMIEQDLKKMLGESVAVNTTCLNVPVFFGHSLSINVECWDPISAEEVKELLSYIDKVEVSGNGDLATAVTDAAKSDELFVSRIREDLSCENAINLAIVADNVRRGAALNCVQIAEILTQQYI